MDNKKRIQEMLDKITDEKALEIIRDFVLVPYIRENEGKKMDYKKMIVELLDKVQSEYTLKRVYKLLEYLYLREG